MKDPLDPSMNSQEESKPATALAGDGNNSSSRPALSGTDILDESGFFPDADRERPVMALASPAREPPIEPALSGTEKLAESGMLAHAPAARTEHNRGDTHVRLPVPDVPDGGPQAKRIGRFILLEIIGAGAMGEVYAAYDGQLDRKVAIKLVHSHTDRSHSATMRLLREAQTLAQVSHPNVVQVHEAGEFDGRVFLAMEYIRGVTLRKWLEARQELPRRTRQREIVQQFVAAGRGLQAAHDAGLAHRDFKPDNVLIGDDGRLRVVDFGLARVVPVAETGEVESDEDAVDVDVGQPQLEPAPSSDMEDTESPFDITPGRKAALALTATGAILGTPRFMAPEQMHGQLADGRSDQFSFCVALFQALFGRFPYPGDSFAELMESVERGAIEPPRSGEAPARVRRALLRGLAVKPDERFASIGDLLDELDGWLQQPRRRSLALMAAIAALGVAYGATQQGLEDHRPMCDGGPREIAQVWNAERKSAIEQAILGVGSPYAKEAWQRVAAGLDSYSTAWADMRRDACLTNQQGDQSDAMLDLRMVCLDRRRDAMDEALNVLAETDEKTLGKTVDVVQKLPRVDFCADTEALLAEVSPPEDPEVRAQVEDLRSRLERVRALQHAGRYEDAANLAQSLAGEAEGLLYPPVHAEALLTEGRVRMNLDPTIEAIPLLARATSIGFRSGTDLIALEAFARQLFTEVITSEDRSALVPPRDMVETLTARRSDGVFVHALLLNNIGLLHLSRGDSERAREYFERFVAAKSNTSVKNDLELIGMHTNLAMLTSDDAKRIALLQQVTESHEQRLGPNHPESLMVRRFYANYHPSPGQAIDLMRPACDRYTRFHPDRIRDRMYCLLYLSFLFAERGQLPAAAAALAPLHTVDIEQVADLSLSKGYAFLYAENYEAALVEFRGFNDTVLRGDSSLWGEKRRALTNLGIGIIEHALGHSRDALVPLKSAMDWFQTAAQRTAEPLNPRLLARARVAVAEASWSVSRDRQAKDVSGTRARACSEITQAMTWYRSAGADYVWRVQALASWHDRCPSLSRGR